MKQGLKQVQKQSLTLTFSLKNQIKLLALSGEAIRGQLNQLIDQHCLEKDLEKGFQYFKDTILIDRYNRFLIKSEKDLKRDSQIIEEEDLRTILLSQLSLLNLKEHEYLIGEYLIDSIQDDGRLDDIDFNDIKSLVLSTFYINVDKTKIEKILLRIQQLEPIGCGYRTITESLIVQSDHLEISPSEKGQIRDILNRIANGKMDLKSLPSKEKKLIKQLKFNPSYGIGRTDEHYFTPDVLAFRAEDGWKISLNDTFMSKALIDKIKTSVESSSLEVKRDTESFFKGLERRQKILLLVAKFIVNKQTKFLDGEGGLIPVTLKEIAQSVNASESTISRIVTSKYLQLPTRNLSLRDLLEKRVNTRSREDESVSPSQLIELIKNLISEEDKSNPLSDKKITRLLKEKYMISLARRTVNKYRHKANMDSKRERISI